MTKKDYEKMTPQEINLEVMKLKGQLFKVESAIVACNQKEGALRMQKEATVPESIKNINEFSGIFKGIGYASIATGFVAPTPIQFIIGSVCLVSGIASRRVYKHLTKLDIHEQGIVDKLRADVDKLKVRAKEIKVELGEIFEIVEERHLNGEIVRDQNLIKELDRVLEKYKNDLQLKEAKPKKSKKQVAKKFIEKKNGEEEIIKEK